MAPCPAVNRTRATTCTVLLLLLWADVVRPPAVAGQAPAAPQPEESATAAIIEAEGDGRGNGTRGGGGGGGGASRNKVVSTIDCQICEATCRVKCLINNLFQWGGCYQRCKADNCNDWCR